MGNFVVSARKYRPQKFSEVIGQESITTTLENALRTDHLAHAFLFCGPRGVGKTTCARILARTLNCENVQNNVDPCGECSSCKSFIKNASFNIIELDAASHNGVEDIRALNEQVRFQPQAGKYKVYIIDEVHMLSASAFNAFLKTLEEPPPHAIFILATTEKHKILPTILSRCQIFDFKRIQIKDIVKHLQEICGREGIEAEADALTVIAQKSDGALRDALSLFDRLASVADKKITYQSVVANLNILDYDVFFKTLDACMREDVRDVLIIFDQVLNDGFEGDGFLSGLASHLRDLLVCQDPRTIHLQNHSDTLKQRYLDQAALMSTSYIFSALNLINQTDITYPQVQNKRLHVEMALSRICFLNRATTISPFHHEKKTVDLTGKKETAIVGGISRSSVPTQAQDLPKAAIKVKANVDDAVDDSVTLPADSNIAHSGTVQPEIPGHDYENSHDDENNGDQKITETTIKEKSSALEGIPSIPQVPSSQPNPIVIGAAGKPEVNAETNASVVSEKSEALPPSLTDEGKVERILSGLSIDIPTLGDISEIEKKVISEEEKARANSLDLTLENLEKWWATLQAGISSPSLVNVFKSTTIVLEDKTVVFEVNSQLAKTRILEEIQLLAALRKDFHDPMLLIRFDINEDANALDNQPRKPQTSKEKYEMLVKKNPNLIKLRDVLDLTVDND